MSNISMKQLKSFVKKMRIADRCVMIIKQGSPIAENLDQLGEVVDQTGVRDVLLLVVEDFDDIDIKTRKEMNELGWYHIDQIRRAAHITSATKESKE